MEKFCNTNSRKLPYDENPKEKKIIRSSKNFEIYHKVEDNKRRKVQSQKCNDYIINDFLREMDKALEETILTDEISENSSDNIDLDISRKVLVFKGTFAAPPEEEKHHHHHRHKSHLNRTHYHFRNKDDKKKKN